MRGKATPGSEGKRSSHQGRLFQVPSKLGTVSKESRPHLFKFDQQAVSVGRVMPQAAKGFDDLALLMEK